MRTLKVLICLCFFCLFVSAQSTTKYFMYKNRKIDTEYFLHNLEQNLADYKDSQTWSLGRKRMFDVYYKQVKTAIRAGRTYIDTNDVAIDNAGILRDVTYWIDANDNVIDDQQYYRLYPKQRRGYTSFWPLTDVVNYVKELAAYIIRAGKYIQ